MKLFQFEHSNNFSNQIKKAIGFRLLFCFILSLIIVFIITLNEIHNSFLQIETKVENQCESLTSFIINQIIIDNAPSIQPKLDSITKQEQNIQITWEPFSNKKQLSSKKLHFMIFSWKYVYPIKYNDDNIGFLLVKGSLLNEKDFFYELLYKLAFLLLFFIAIFIILFPVGKKIPQKLFIEPINNLLLLLRKEKNYTFENVPEEITEISHKITTLLEEMEQRSREAALGQMAARVAHDIRSPLSSMTTMLRNISKEIAPEKREVLEHAVQSVRDIANNLLNQYKTPETDELKNNSVHFDDGNLERYILLASMIDLVLSQKRYEWQDNPAEIHFSIQKEAKIAWIFTAPNEIKRVLSNLLNNAYEALREHRAIYLDCLVVDNKLILHIKDTGEGIAADKIPLVLNGKSLKKGHGLGLSGAKKFMQDIHGDLQLVSHVNEGTTVTLIFSMDKSPDWFPEAIHLPANKPILFLDDDISMHKFWMSHAHPVRLNHFSTSEDLLIWVEENPDKIDNMIILSDYELKETLTGLDVLEKLAIGKRSYLITSYAETFEIQRRCEALGIYLIQKSVLSEIPVLK